MTGIALEKDMNRPFAVSLASGLPEHIRRDDVQVLRDEYYALYEKFLAESAPIRDQIEIQLAQAQAAGFDTKGW